MVELILLNFSTTGFKNQSINQCKAKDRVISTFLTVFHEKKNKTFEAHGSLALS